MMTLEPKFGPRQGNWEMDTVNVWTVLGENDEVTQDKY